MTFDPSLISVAEPQLIGGIPGDPCGLTVAHGGVPFDHGLSDGHISEKKEQDANVNKLKTPQGDSGCTQQQLHNSQHRKKKSKKHKEKERERLKSDKGAEWLQSSPDLKQNPEKLDSKSSFSCFFFSPYVFL